MNCWNCETQLIWGGDDDLEEEGGPYIIVSNLSCPECSTYVEVYHPDPDHPDWQASRAL